MSDRSRDETPTELRIVVTPYFNVAATMSFLDPFRAANYLEGMALFRWQIVSEKGGLVSASNGTDIATIAFADAAMAKADILFVSSSWEPEAYLSPMLRATLRQADKRQTLIGGIDTGAFILAHAGLLEGYTATVHYEHIDAFQELFPNTAVSEALWVIDRRRVTCCGGSATLDLALHMIQQSHGSALANATARYVFAPPLRNHGATQLPEQAEPLGNSVPTAVRAAIRVMEANLETPLSISALCEEVGLSHRQLDRLFAQCVRKTPALYYRDIRLDRARGFVTQTAMPMSEIAFASGFSSQVHFSRAYKDRFGLPPSKDRIQGRIPFEFRAWPMHRAPKGKAD
ncbi:GlxA family transcriptional regulator [Lutimaribacter marinistellae]|uniref:GlxA family transcriptional regulator n=1 Tax=Lutimaribacter marinistellae TaxID=1820329 RepID=A0ABV7TEF1_9RHOB